ncbi:hypothetical protein VNO80_23146 [Phaseolus coccineus]|uniref:Uncharacterized protein n=1 Tax=Phaseolus coccineus TaxID=3886 RepID=A0AAN9M5E8_PHACN
MHYFGLKDSLHSPHCFLIRFSLLSVFAAISFSVYSRIRNTYPNIVVFEHASWPVQAKGASRREGRR